MKPFKIQNRSQTSRRVKFIKNGGLIQFTKDPIASFVENSREAGFCLNPIEPLPLMVDALGSIDLTAHPMGTDGRVSLFVEGELTQSVRYSNLNRLADRQTWFNQEFGTVITYTGREIAVFESLTPEVTYRLVFEDDDLDYEFGEFGLEPSSINPTLIVEQYRLAFDLNKAPEAFVGFNLICSNSVMISPQLMMGDEEYEFTVNDTVLTGSTLSVDSAVSALREIGIEAEIIDLGTPITLSVNVVDVNTTEPSIKFWNKAAPNDTYVHVDWGDGAFEKVAVRTWNSSSSMYHTYAQPGDYTIKIYHPSYAYEFEFYGIHHILDWGDETRATKFYLYSDELETVPAHLPPLWTDLSWVFSGANNIKFDISSWDTSNVTNMESTFRYATDFNQDLSGWNVSNVTNMLTTFLGASSFNGNITTWDVSKVTNMANMFNGCSVFNQDISSWVPLNVTNMYGLFYNASTFNQNISQWCVPKIQSLPGDFVYGAPLMTAEKLPVWGTCPRGENLPPPPLTFKISATEYDRYLMVDSWTLESGTAITVDWGDGSPIESFDDTSTSLPYHNYTTGTEATCTLDSNKPITQLWFWGDSVTEIVNFGKYGITSPKFSFSELIKVPNALPSYVTDMSDMFYDCSKFTGVGVSTWDTSRVVSMSTTFSGCDVFNQDISGWDTSNVTDMSSMFDIYNGEGLFNQNIGSWNTSKVTTMNRMFMGCANFNQDISGWDVSKVTDMTKMFSLCTTFNKPLNGWNTSSVVVVYDMFRLATNFNQPIGSWNVSNCVNFGGMFNNARAFNQPLGNWNLTSAQSLDNMFSNAVAFNQPLNNWNVSTVTTMSGTFSGTAVFDQPLDLWDVSNVTTMYSMFGNAKAFNQDISGWNTSNVTSLYGMFSGTILFNKPLNGWNTSKVTEMGRTFENSVAFNQPLDAWDVSQVTNITSMFAGTKAFNQPIGSWNVSKVDATAQWGGPINNMAQVFKNAIAFNQDLSQWCVGLFLVNPYEFDLGAANWTLPSPVWGTCPRGENVV